MPVHNATQTLAAAVGSVLAQSYADWELLLTDDGSTDGSWAMLSEFAEQDDRVKPERTDSAGGAAQARNLAIERSQGRWVAFLDSDDLWLPDKLERQLSFMVDTGAPLTFSSYYKVAADYSGDAAQFTPNSRIIAARDQVNYATMLQANYIGCLTAIYDREQVGTRLMPTIRKRQDYALWLDILREGHVARGLSSPLALYRESRPGSLSGNKRSLVRYNWQLYREIEGLSVPRSALSLATSTIRSVRNSRI